MGLDAHSLDGKTALVTGASRGIGEAVALSLAAAGARLILLARGEDGLQDVAEQVDAMGVECSTLPVDVTDREGVAGAVAEWTDTGGPIEILVNNAGTNVRRKADEYTLDEWDHLIDLNLTAAFHLSRLVLPGMREKGFGRIVNVSSVSGLVALSTGAPYAAAKAGMIQLTKNLAREWGPYGVTVNCVAPWYVRTELTEPVLSNPDFLQRVLAATPAGRIGTPQDIASAITFLCSPASSWINGVCIPLDGGFTAAAF